MGEKLAGQVAWLALVIFAWVGGLLVGRGVEQTVMRDEAAKAGHAEYYLDENHERCWRWLPAKGE